MKTMQQKTQQMVLIGFGYLINEFFISSEYKNQTKYH